MAHPKEQTIAEAVLPHYRCHKVVRAARIYAQGSPTDDGENIYVVVSLTDEDERRGEYTFPKHTAVLLVPKDVYARKPENAGYIVVYDDGYVSWSPSKAFEEGYTRIEGPGK